MIWTGIRAYDPLSKTYSSGYWIVDGWGYLRPVWND